MARNGAASLAERLGSLDAPRADRATRRELIDILAMAEGGRRVEDKTPVESRSRLSSSPDDASVSLNAAHGTMTTNSRRLVDGMRSP